MHGLGDLLLYGAAAVAVTAFLVELLVNRSPLRVSLFVVGTAATLVSVMTLLSDGFMAMVTAIGFYFGVAAILLFPALLASGLARMIRLRISRPET